MRLLIRLCIFCGACVAEEVPLAGVIPLWAICCGTCMRSVPASSREQPPSRLGGLMVRTAPICSSCLICQGTTRSSCSRTWIRRLRNACRRWYGGGWRVSNEHEREASSIEHSELELEHELQLEIALRVGSRWRRMRNEGLDVPTTAGALYDSSWAIQFEMKTRE